MLWKVLKRQAVLFRRDPTLTRARIAQSLVMGFLVGGLWFQLEVSYRNARCALCQYDWAHAHPEIVPLPVTSRSSTFAKMHAVA
jgi:hypothetical protein